MRRLLFWSMTFAVAASAQLPREVPAGMVFSDGATVARQPRQSTAARPGELLLAGDRVKAGANGVSLLSCADKRIVKLAPNSEATVTPQGIDAPAANVTTERLVSGCFLPPVKRMAVAGPTHLGATTMRGDTLSADADSLNARVERLPSPARERLVERLKSVQGGDAVAFISRAALLEEAGLLGDASMNYQRALTQLPGASWIQTKLMELADAKERRAAK